MYDIWSAMSDVVQEAYRCPDFERRRPGSGYRG